MSYPFVVITLHCLEKIAVDRGTRRINVERTGTGETFKEIKPHPMFANFFRENDLNARGIFLI